MSSISDVLAGRELMVNLTLRELRSKYKRSALGWAWSLANPLVSMLIFTVVFALFLKVSPPVGEPSGLHNFALFLLCGLLPWNFFANAVMASTGVVIANAGLVKKVYFPRSVLVFASVNSWGASFLIEMAVLAVALLAVGNFVLPWLLPTLLVMVLLALFTSGIALAVAALNVYFRDVQHLIGVVVQLLFYATPIVYPVTLVPDRLRRLYMLNPLAAFVEAIRDCLYDLSFPSLGRSAYLVTVSLAVFALGFVVFSRLEPRMAEEL